MKSMKCFVCMKDFIPKHEADAVAGVCPTCDLVVWANDISDTSDSDSSDSESMKSMNPRRTDRGCHSCLLRINDKYCEWCRLHQLVDRRNKCFISMRV